MVFMNMLINSNIAYDISKHIRQNIYLFSSFENVYLFGSILDDSKFSNDDVCCKRCISNASNTTYSQLICGRMI